MQTNAERIKQSKRIVIKIGASSLFDLSTGIFKSYWLTNLAILCKELAAQDKEIIIVSSGAIAFGCNFLRINYNKAKLQEKQFVSTIGQLELMQRYQEDFAKHELTIAQVLLTIEDVENRKRYLSIRKTLDLCLENKIIPIINQNDVISTAEIRFGDNDRLSGRVAQISNADLLILFSEVNGLYTDDPHLVKNAHLIKEVYDVNVDIEKMAGDSPQGTGGMSAKVAAAKIALNAKCVALILNNEFNSLDKIIEGNQMTWFIPDNSSHAKYIKF